MTQTYRTDDFARWGAGQGFNLSPAQVDINFWDLVQRMIAQEDRADAPPGIDHFEIIGSNLYVHMDDDTTILGPYIVPVAVYRDRGAWSSETSYSAMDTFSENGGLYVVLLAHTSDLTFDAGANDGLGNDYYQLMLQPPGTALPTGGAAAMVLEKSTGDDFEMTWGYKLPEDGSTRQYLIKQSSAQQDADWGDPQASDIEFTPVTGSLITSTTVDDALEELSGGTAINASGIPFVPNSGNGMTSDNVEDAINELADSAAGSSIGRHTIWMPAGSMTPTLTNGAAAGLVELATNDIMLRTLDFDSTTAEYAQFEIAMPKSWDRGSLYFKSYWSHASTTTNFGVVWELNCSCISNDDGMDTSLPFFATVSDTGGTTNDLYITDESSELSVSAAESDLLIFKINRAPSETDDTMAVDARLQGLQIIYSTNAATDD